MTLRAREHFNRYLESTLLRADATAADVRGLCEEAALHRFVAVCVNPSRLLLAREVLRGTDVRLCTVIAFPLGAEPASLKVEQARWALQAGAQELDMVMNLGAFKDLDYRTVREEISQLSRLAHDQGALLKVIIETALLTPDEIKLATAQVAAGGADYVKTSTGFAASGAHARDVRLMRAVAPEWLKIKASGGIRSLAQALELIEVGADRIGTSVAGSLMHAYLQLEQESAPAPRPRPEER
ncbi:MAG: deoxyribose-phosphate aldolase [Syntrophomonadaceae bacterium]|jgi:deoxyribose-phosphate aldolase|nr:deoxyribose-phosphate aldolase [Syntrophomonadaceae bacterium]MDH7498106.1 deoxyribose-phosphate aldolase [Syntrophomonadaceae bacterium]